MLPLYALEEMDAETFDLIGSDACAGLLAGEIGIEPDRRPIEGSHGEAGHLGSFAQDKAGLGNRKSRVERVGAACELRQLKPRRLGIGRSTLYRKLKEFGLDEGFDEEAA